LAIRLKKDYHLELEMARVWDAINDPDTLASILPNCESLETISENQYEAQVKVKVGPISSKFKSILKIFDIEEFEGYKFEVRGNGVKGSMAGFGEIKLDPDGSGTRFTFIAEGNVTGIIARVGQRFIEATGKKIMDQGMENFKQQIASKA
jgi:carbon monoxide dehydrogenase subunit G